MHGNSRTRRGAVRAAVLVVVLAVSAVAVSATQATPTRALELQPTVTSATAFDVSQPLRDLARGRVAPDVDEAALAFGPEGLDIQPAESSGVRAPALVAKGTVAGAQRSSAAIPTPIRTFEGLSNQDNFNVFGFRVNPPDPVGDVGPNHYVEMINLVFGVYSKTGTLLLGPVDTGTLWAGFPVTDCTDPSGDPIVVHDQVADRWILSQFTTSGLSDPTRPFWNCVAISQTPDPTGAYYRYAFETENFQFFPDYPKYGIWKDTYVITTREFGPTVEYGIGIYAIDRNKMINGQPDAQVVSFFLDGNDPAILPLVGDGLLPADVDGKTKPKQDATIPIVGTQDDGAGYGATFDALNVFELDVHWNANAEPDATLELAAQLPVAAFDSIFPCAPASRDCLPQPGITNPTQFLDILSYRQRPTWRLAYRSFGTYESLVTNQSVEAAPGVAGVRWYELRRVDGTYSVYQQGTYNPGDGVHRWMGSIAQDKKGNMALGYSVVNGTTVKPGIRYTGRLKSDPLGSMGALGEGTIVAGTGVQTTTTSRWGDYTSMNVDPVDDCTFWYVNEYYTAAGQASSLAGWQTRIAAFKLPGC
jgi:hypothetical protein